MDATSRKSLLVLMLVFFVFIPPQSHSEQENIHINKVIEKLEKGKLVTGIWPLNPDNDLMVIIMIEDPDGVRNIDEIVKVPGIGAVFFGPADYTIASRNFGNDTFDVDEVLHKVKATCDRASVPFVGFANRGNIVQKVGEKHRMLIIGMDIDKSVRAQDVLEYLKEQQK